MVTVGLLVRLEAKEGREDDVATFLKQGRRLVDDEQETVAWFGVRTGPSTFAIFDVFPDDSGRDRHLGGPVAEALMARSDDLFSVEPAIDKVEVIAAKVPPFESA